jgi:hypothetical protein
MANYKKKKRRRGGVVGCCGMCMLRRFSCIHHRRETLQEQRSRISEKEQLKEYEYEI